MSIDTQQTAIVAAPPAHPICKAEDLTQGGKQAFITLGNQTYTLRITRAQKLILTK